MINKIREDIKNKQGKKYHFRFNGARNQIEEFDGIITEIYNYIFIIKSITEKVRIKSFTYTDILIGNLVIS